MNLSFLQRLQEELNHRKQNQNFRILPSTTAGIDFYSNDYLGMAQNDEIARLVMQNYSSTPDKKKLGSTGSRLISGNSEYFINLETFLANFFHADAALIFNSGYTAISSVIATLPSRHDTILYDELAHACMKEGARLSLAKHYSFRHNDMNDLEKKLQKAQGTPFIVVESVYSMDGDFCPLPSIVTLAQQYNACIILDEAHSTGIYGTNGNGWACQLKLESFIDVRIYTFGKAIGAHGAVVVGSQTLKDYLINFARGFIYTTAMPLHNLITLRTIFEYLLAHSEPRKQLQKIISIWQNSIQSKELLQVSSNASPIQIVKIQGNTPCIQTAEKLRAKGFLVKAVLSPTVKSGQERIRICLHAFNTEQQVEQLIDSLQQMLSP
ncbi:MAG: pyridoxal phosphate-dependent aminotransferase family protein [Cytophagales bacterium]|nr:pyridoxal phosphate-dependent aminotransferase family protein [Cytophagales bacterium]MDW8383143.1 pyridoxal phosphate-dependent aminotransferase family protein [Flammeovirgaceae bacterium]